MNKIRINELARELEVKPSRILEVMPELGVIEKRTHSSSIDEDIADIIRRHLGGVSVGGDRETPVPEAAAEAPAPEAADEAAAEPVSTPPVVISLTTPPVVDAGALPDAGPVAGPPLAGPMDAPRPVAPPLRPPLSAGRPLTPPVGAMGVRQAAIPGRPVPTPPATRPGQILSGPRRPLPPSTHELPRPSVPAIPLPPPAVPSIPVPPAAKLPGPPLPAQPAARTLAGQPMPRPVVPPRPDLVARIEKQKSVVPGQPIARPARPAAPVPGQPIYRGPIRPGQPLVRGPMTPAPGSPMSRPRRGMPLAPPMPVGPLPVGDQRRHQTKARTVARDREEQEGKLSLIRRAEEQVQAVNKDITISEGLTVKELSEKLGIKASLVIKRLVDRKVFATINQTLDVKLAQDLAAAFGAVASHLSYEEEATQEVELAEDPAALVKRAPVVTVMGHVDHGKTSLLDAIRETNVAAREAGGITQHIGAYQVFQNGRKVVFVDTPGHEAFTRMRARGARVTDIVVLVVAADDGVMPQTIEAIDHAKAAGVPIIVAINKTDKPEAQPDRVKQQLSDRGLVAEDWGGQTVMVPVSAKTKHNLGLLIEMILLVADLQDLKCNLKRPAVCTIVEAELDRGRGPVARVLVRNGMLRVGDYFICGTVFGRVRALFDDLGQPTREAEPATPVEVIGLESLPEVGETLQVVSDTAKAKQIVVYREAKVREQQMARGRVSLERLHEQLQEGSIKELNIILKADVGGSAEVLTETLQKLSGEKVRIRVLHSGVGAITETDVLLASASNAIVIGFNVRPERNAAQVAETEKVDLRLHTIIYELTHEIKRAMTGLLEPVFKEVYLGRARVRDTFRISKVGMVAGCTVQDGLLKRGCQLRLLRDNIVIHTGRIDSLKRFKDDVSEVKTGLECGVAIAGYGDVKPDDVLEAFLTERVAAEALT